MFIAVLNIRSKRNKGENCIFEFCSFQRKEIKKLHLTARNGGPGMQLLAARRPNSVLRAQGSFTGSALAHFCICHCCERKRASEARSQQQHNVANLCCDTETEKEAHTGTYANCSFLSSYQQFIPTDIDN